MRQRGAFSIQVRTMMDGRRLRSLALTGWLVFTLVPTAALATPPEPGAPAVANDSATKAGSDNETPPATTLSSPEESPSPDDTAASYLAAAWGSVRRRGLEAPVQLRRPEPATDAPDIEKGDGVPSHPAAKLAQKAEGKEKKDELAQQNVRVWPMRAKSYTFTQPFGCVPQIANFYFPGDGCPPDAPVVHSGVDLAAPEGTPFYAAAAGWVTDSGYDREVGVPNTRIIIQHVGRNEGYATEYLHWIASYVDVGDYVEAGEMIGEVGSVGYSTGPHLHFSVVDLDSGEHLDPIGWLPKTPGNDGYRGLQPNAKASMRLPAGTTAGLPEMADPAPPSPPEREDVPNSPREGKHKGKHHGKHKRDGKSERAAKRESASSDPSDQGADSGSRHSTADNAADHEKDKGKHKNRTHKRERNKDGKSHEDAASGDNGDASHTADRTDEPRPRNTSKHDNRGNRRGNGNGNGKHSDNHDRGQRDSNNQDSGGGKDNRKDKNAGRNNGDHDGHANSPDNGGKPGGKPRGDDQEEPDPGGDTSTDGDEDQPATDDGSSGNGETGKHAGETTGDDAGGSPSRPERSPSGTEDPPSSG